ncbi:class I SAM-dependent methyltransferase [Lentibacillus sp. CBA3610]|uniref:tRNA (adenine(22)-N(1))-methyltransferase n=1 Tax=Lentibacillus sp. CBA3610 TaxID=2518176 RepID=UPI001595E059|nr:class I SAM-dependent methyltransferase [Lentibacillus sp. CBA3610]QKY69477.1 tRNA (adenine(22)-N(1))-methyltransferase TrmK [Lentibacillus sp. CBA3610]
MNNSIKLSGRLENVASLIPKGAEFADIGSDHGYLPCYVCLHDESAQAVAGEVNEGPFLSAQETVKRYGLAKRIDVRLGNGLEILKDGEVNLVVLAGMGGALISTILDEGKDRLKSIKRIIAQPNVGERRVRQWFYTHGYTITNEAMIKENGHIYEIIAGDKNPTTQEMTEKQLLFGPRLLKQKPELFYQKWENEYAKRQRIIDQMKKAALPNDNKIEAFKKELTWIEEVLRDDSH